LQYLELYFDLRDGDVVELVESIKLTLKSGLKKLASLKLNDEAVRLGTEWTGI
jgi:hypothetical protein